ncbi:MAG: hypothetical protein JRH20_04880 [Deltaproteobacteria bacterium]|nr:hypothetical protein [Deltaproteobacteria bacterium]
MSRSVFACLLIISWCCTANAAPTVDGVVDGEYGAALASDGAGDYATSVARKPQWDLVDLHITHDETFLYVAFSLLGSVDENATEEKSFLFYVDTTNDQAGATSDAWTRQIVAKDPHKPEYSINTWIKGTGAYGASNARIRTWTGSAWSPTEVVVTAAAAHANANGTVIEWKVARSDIGDPSEIWVEVLSTGTVPTDNAQDTINAPKDDWNAPTGATQWTALATVSSSTHYRLVAPADFQVDVLVDSSVDGAEGDSSVDTTVDAGPDTTHDVGSGDLPDEDLGDQRVTDVTHDGVRPDVRVDGAIVDGGGGRDAMPYVDAGAPDGGGDGCGCAARGEHTAQLSLPLLLALGFIGRRRRRP